MTESMTYNIQVAGRLPDRLLQKNLDLLIYYDDASHHM
jgi:hypothetical protein